MWRLSLGAALVSAIVIGAAVAGTASASQLIDRNPRGLTLQVNGKGEALLTYTARGTLHHVIAWGAVNAQPPRAGVPQLKLQLDYTGGYGKYFKLNPAAQALVAEYKRIKGTPGYLANPVVKKLQQAQQAADLYWQTGFHGGCAPYDGPALAWSVLTCKAPDGSFWAVQEWQRELPDYGVAPTPDESVWELRLSHWTGPLPVLTIGTDWSFGGQWDHIFGFLTYLGKPVYGFHSTSGGNPLDSYGRNVYIDTLDSEYGAGWRRENSALTHTGSGVFCYSFNPHGDHPDGQGSRYRVTVIGPGATPDVMWVGNSPGPYDRQADQAANRRIDALHDSQCAGN